MNSYGMTIKEAPVKLSAVVALTKDNRRWGRSLRGLRAESGGRQADRRKRVGVEKLSKRMSNQRNGKRISEEGLGRSNMGSVSPRPQALRVTAQSDAQRSRDYPQISKVTKGQGAVVGNIKRNGAGFKKAPHQYRLRRPSLENSNKGNANEPHLWK